MINFVERIHILVFSHFLVCKSSLVHTNTHTVIFLVTDTPDAPTDLEMESFDKRTCNLKWKKPAHDGGNPIKGEC